MKRKEIVDDGLFFELSDDFRVERTTDDEGKPGFAVCYPAEAEEDAMTLTVSVSKIDMPEGEESFMPPEECNLPGNVKALIYNRTLELPLLMSSAKILTGMAVVEEKGLVYSFYWQQMEKRFAFSRFAAHPLTEILNSATVGGKKISLQEIKPEMLWTEDMDAISDRADPDSSYETITFTFGE